MPIRQHKALLGLPLSAEPPAELGDIESRRTSSAVFFSDLKSKAPKTDVDHLDIDVPTGTIGVVRCKLFTKRGAKLPGSAVLHVHGGGMIHSSVDDHIPLIDPYVSQTGVPFFSVDYRLAPETQAPGQVHDCFAALQYLLLHATEMGIDPTRIAVMGDSAGGGIAACLVHYTRRVLGSSIFSKQILIYPMLDDRNTLGDPELEGSCPLWTYDDNRTGWSALLGARIEQEHLSVIEAAGRMTPIEARGLPATYMDLGDLDIFRDEDLLYAQKLLAAGVSVELHLLTGMPHGYDLLVPDEPEVRAVYNARLRVISDL